MKVIFVRHGESTANIGLPSNNHAQIALTSRGHRQAEELAKSWSDYPTRILLSPFLRTQLTAAPTITRFQGVPVEVLPMEEFTYLEPDKWKGSTALERRPSVDAYWKANDPELCVGPGAESFSMLLARARLVLDRLEAFSGLAYAFTHGQFMLALKVMLRHSWAGPKELMSRFYEERSFGNTEKFSVELLDGFWQPIREVPKAHPDHIIKMAATIGPGKTTTLEDFLRKFQERRGPQNPFVVLGPGSEGPSVKMEPIPREKGWDLNPKGWDFNPQPTSALFCEHANESPRGYCSCPPDCYCRFNSCRRR